MASLAIADPPYLGRAALWYGSAPARTYVGQTPGRARGRSHTAVEHHHDADRWDDADSHIGLIQRLEAEFDGWVLAASSKTFPALACGIPDTARVAVWHVTNAIPDGARVGNRWEPVIVRVPDSRRARRPGGLPVWDVLTAPHPQSGFVGAKPEAWVRWVLDMLGHEAGDEVVDLFPGSGTVDRVLREGVLL